jgi:hypothetical protein
MTLQKTATQIHYVCESQNIQLTSYWIPKTKNDHGDQLSRIIDHDDWDAMHFFFMFWRYGLLKLRTFVPSLSFGELARTAAYLHHKNIKQPQTIKLRKY